MMRRFLCTGILLIVPSCTLLADFSYEQTSTITGGAMMAMMKFAGAFSKQAREPNKSTVLVHGNRMVHISANRASIIDLDKETITDVDYQKKQYSVMTFADMKAMVEAVGAKTSQGTEFKVTAEVTGAARKISGLDAKEMLIKMEMQTTDPKSGKTGSMLITTNSWVASGIAGYDEVRDFQKRMAEKLSWSPGGGMMMGRPDMAKGMAEGAKEMSKLDGIPILQYVKMGGPAGMGGPEMTPEQQAQMSDAQRQQQQAQQQQQQQAPAEQSQQAQSAPPPAAAGGQPGGAGSLMEMTMELTAFSSAPVDGSKLEVPAGFKQVESATRGRR